MSDGTLNGKESLPSELSADLGRLLEQLKQKEAEVEALTEQIRRIKDRADPKPK